MVDGLCAIRGEGLRSEDVGRVCQVSCFRAPTKDVWPAAASGVDCRHLLMLDTLELSRD